MKSRKCCVCGGPIRAGRCSYCGMPYRKERTLSEIERANSRAEKLSAVQRSQRERTDTRRKTADQGLDISREESAVQKARAEERKQKLQQQAARMEELRKRQQEIQRRTRGTTASSYKSVRKKSGAGILIFIIFLVFIISIFSQIVGKVRQEIDGYGVDFSESTQEYNPEEERARFLEELDEELSLLKESSTIPQEGETLQLFLEAGNYEAGREIPAGTYCVTPDQSENMSLNIITPDVNIFTFVEEDNGISTVSTEKIEELVLQEGSMVKLEGAGSLSFSTENAQTDIQAVPVANPLTQSLMLKDSISVGTDLESGTYDLIVEEGYGIISVEGPEKYESYYVSNDSYAASDTFRNIHLEEGDTVTVQSGEGLVLRPSSEVYE